MDPHFETLLQVEKMALDLLRFVASLTPEVSSLQIALSEDKTIVFLQGENRVLPTLFHTNWAQRGVICARVAQVAIMSGWPSAFLERKDGGLTTILSLSRPDSTSATCLSGADLQNIDSRPEFQRPRLPDPRPTVELGTPLCGGFGFPPEKTPR